MFLEIGLYFCVCTTLNGDHGCEATEKVVTVGVSTRRVIKKLNNVSAACACLWALSALRVLMCRLKRVNWCSIGSFRVSSPAVPGTFCIMLHTPGLYSLFPSAPVLLHGLTQLKVHSNAQILKAFEQHNFYVCISYSIGFISGEAALLHPTNNSVHLISVLWTLNQDFFCKTFFISLYYCSAGHISSPPVLCIYPGLLSSQFD